MEEEKKDAKTIPPIIEEETSESDTSSEEIEFQAYVWDETENDQKGQSSFWKNESKGYQKPFEYTSGDEEDC